MAITKNVARQGLLFAYVDVTYDDLVSGAAAEAIDLPYGAVVAQGAVTVTTAFNSATTDVLDIGDSGDTDRYTTSAIDISATGRTALTPTGFVSVGNAISAEWTGTGTAPTAGAFTLEVGYFIKGRAEASYG